LPGVIDLEYPACYKRGRVYEGSFGFVNEVKRVIDRGVSTIKAGAGEDCLVKVIRASNQLRELRRLSF
jgi:hypothetical protein